MYVKFLQNYKYFSVSVMSLLLSSTGIETSDKPEVFPQDKRFKVGSRVTFCCIVPAGEVFNKMYLNGYNDFHMNTTRISNQTYTLTGYLNHATRGSCTEVICETNKHENRACAYIGCKYDLISFVQVFFLNSFRHVNISC